MSSREEKLAEVFRDKPELLLPPEWMLPAAELEALAQRPGVAVVELAGRDSVAAALKAVAELGLERLVPSYVYTGSEYGPWPVVEQAWRRLAEALPDGVELSPLLVLGWPELWRALAGRLLGLLSRRYGFSPACPACHLYLHLMRAPLALALGRAPVVAGERESHDGRIKLNQLPLALDAYAQAVAGFGLELVMPLRAISQGDQISRILGRDWAEGAGQPACLLSGNYLGPGGQVDYEPGALHDFLHEYALPLASGALSKRLAGQAVDPVALALEQAAG